MDLTVVGKAELSVQTENVKGLYRYCIKNYILQNLISILSVILSDCNGLLKIGT